MSSPVQAIKKFCAECCGGSFKMVKECVVGTCVLYPFRLGTNPNLKRRGRSSADMAKIRQLAKGKNKN